MSGTYHNLDFKAYAEDHPSEMEDLRSEYEHHKASGGQCSFQSFAMAVLSGRGDLSIFPPPTMGPGA